MARRCVVFLLVLAATAHVQSLSLKPLHSLTPLLKHQPHTPTTHSSTHSFTHSLHTHSTVARTRVRGGAIFDDPGDQNEDSEEEGEGLFAQLERLNQLAALQRDLAAATASTTASTTTTTTTDPIWSSRWSSPATASATATATATSSRNQWSNILKRNQKKMGLALMTTGIFFTLLGMMLFFEGNLLRIGNLSFLTGTTLLVGPMRISQFFMQPKRLRATVSLVLGVFLVLIKWSKLGILLEIFGFFNLFGNMFPLLYRLLRSLPGVGGVLTALEGKSNVPQSRTKASDKYKYDDNLFR